MTRISNYNTSSSVKALGVNPLSNSNSSQTQYIFAGGTGYSINVYSLQPKRDYFKLEEYYARMFQEPPPEDYIVASLVGHSGKVLVVDTDPTGSILASGSEDFSICLWKLRFDAGGMLYPCIDPARTLKTFIQKPYTKICRHKGHITGIAFSEQIGNNTCYLASCSTDHSLVVWSLHQAEGKSPKLSEVWNCPKAHQSVVSAVCWGRGELSGTTLFSCGWDHSIRVWSANAPITGSNRSISMPEICLVGHTSRVSKIACSTDGRHLVSVSADSDALLWETSGRYHCLCKYTFSCPAISVVSANEYFVTGSENGMIIVWPILCEKHKEAFDATSDKTAIMRRRSRGSTVARSPNTTRLQTN